jgi:hypothetical protein
MIDDAEKGTVFFRIVISPDPEREDTYQDLSLPESRNNSRKEANGQGRQLPKPLPLSGCCLA